MRRLFNANYTLIIETNTHAGVMGGHLPDALVPNIVADYAISQSIFPETCSLPKLTLFFSDRDLAISGQEILK